MNPADIIAPITDKTVAIDLLLEARVNVRTVLLSTLPGTKRGNLCVTALDSIDDLITDLNA